MSTENTNSRQQSESSDGILEQYDRIIPEIAHLDTRDVRLVKENDELKNKIPTESKSVLDAESKNRLKNFKNKLIRAEHEIERKTKEILELRKKIHSIGTLESRIALLQDENEKIHNQLAQRVREVETLRNENKELVKTKQNFLCEKNKEIEGLKKSLKELETLPNQLAETKKHIELLSREAERKAELVRERDKEIEKLHRLIKQSEQEKCENPKDHIELKKKAKEIEVQAAEMRHAKNHVELLRSEYEHQIANVQGRKKEIENLNKALQKSDLNFKRSSQIENLHIEKLEREIKTMIMKVEDKQNEIEELKRKASTNVILQQSWKILEDENKKLEHKVNKVEQLNNQLQRRTEDLISDVFELHGQLKQREQAIAALEKENKELKSSNKETADYLVVASENNHGQISALKESLNRINNENANLKKENMFFKQEYDQLVLEKIEFLETIKNQSHEIEVVRSQIEALNAEKQNLSGIRSKNDNTALKTGNIESQIKDLEGNISNLIQENKSLHQKMTELEKQKNAVAKVLKHREIQVESLRESLIRATALLAAENEKLLQNHTANADHGTKSHHHFVAINTKSKKPELFGDEKKDPMEKTEEVRDKLTETRGETNKFSSKVNKSVFSNSESLQIKSTEIIQEKLISIEEEGYNRDSQRF